jgi:hypothetical protein
MSKTFERERFPRVPLDDFALRAAIETGVLDHLEAVPIMTARVLGRLAAGRLVDFPSPASRKLDENGLPAALQYPGKRPDNSYSLFNQQVSPVALQVDRVDSVPEKEKQGLKFYVKVKNNENTEGIFCLDDLLLHAEAPPMAERFPIIAFGSNANPGQLSQKFNELEGADRYVVPVLKGLVKGVLPVYVARIGINGYVFTDLVSSSNPEAQCEVFINFLSKNQLEIMDATEGAYSLCELPNTAITINDGSQITTSAYLYVGKEDDAGVGFLTDEKGKLIRLAELRAEGDGIDNEFGALTQQQVQQYIYNIAVDEIVNSLMLDKKPDDIIDVIKLIINRAEDKRLAKLRESNEQLEEPVPLGRLITRLKIQDAIQKTGRVSAAKGKSIRSRIPLENQNVSLESVKTFGQIISP